MPRYRLTLEYAGTRYSGWQAQQNARTVQGELNRALAEAADGKVATYGSGRTDAGVHALAQVAHADLTRAVPPATLRRRTNDALPHDINVLSVEQVPPRFHARHSAVARSYIYQVATRRSAFAKPFVWWVKDPLDVGAMQQAAASLTGFRDFRAFADDDPEEKSTTVELQRIQVAEAGPLILIRVVGSHFLWKMVRRIAGVLVAAGRGELAPAAVAGLPGSSSGVPARLTAPASGLFLERVFYEPPPAGWPLESAAIRLDRSD